MKFSLLLTLLLPITAFSQKQVRFENMHKGIEFITNGASQGPSALNCEEEKIPLSEQYSQNGADCSDFVKADGSLGPLGTTIKDHMHSIDDALFFSPDLPGAKNVCPTWGNLSRAQKEYFWVWLIAAISWKESTCGAATLNTAATHGTAAGHLQLNKSRKDRAWRGGESGNSCKVADIVPAENNIKCGIEILHELLKGKEGLYEGNGNIFGRGANSYWQDLRRPDGGKIIELLKEFPPCN